MQGVLAGDKGSRGTLLDFQTRTHVKGPFLHPPTASNSGTKLTMYQREQSPSSAGIFPNLLNQFRTLNPTKFQTQLQLELLPHISTPNSST